MEILITGGTGAIGQNLVKSLLKLGHSVTIIGRDKKKIIDLYGSKVLALNWTELYKIKKPPKTIVHLAGMNIGNMLWTKSNKQMAFDSRIKTADILHNWCLKQEQKPHIIHTSGATYYGLFKDKNIVCDESTPATIHGEKFMQQLAIACEQCFANLPKTTLRLAPVLDLKSGMLPKLLLPAKFGLASVIGSGSQPIAWISMTDAVRAIMMLIEHPEITGAINVCSPEIISQKEFTDTLAKALARPRFLTTPEFVLRILAGEFAEQLILKGQAITPKRLLELGFKHKHSSFAEWLRTSI